MSDSETFELATTAPGGDDAQRDGLVRGGLGFLGGLLLCGAALAAQAALLHAIAGRKTN